MCAEVVAGNHTINDDDENWPAGLLTPELQKFYNPEGTVDATTLVDYNSGNEERGICALPYLRERDGATVWFPANIIGNLYLSNGMSAGNTAAEARTQALSEIFERDVKFRIIKEGLCLPDVPEEVLARYPCIAAGIRELRAAGFGILVKDASLDGFPEPSFDLEDIAQPENLEIHFVDSSGIISWSFLRATPDFAFSDWNFSHTTAEDYAWSVAAIHATGHDIYVADFSHLGVYACRILVPGMSDIYPVEDLEWDNSGVGNDIREPILYLTDLDDDECADLLERLNELGLADQRPVAALIGLAADAGSLWKELRVGELKTLLALAIGDLDAVREGCDWIRHFNQISVERQLVYRCIESLIGLGDAAAYAESLQHLYGAATLQQAKALLSREQRFFGLNAPGLNLEGCEMHQRLLAAYAKLNAAKQQA